MDLGFRVEGLGLRVGSPKDLKSKGQGLGDRSFKVDTLNPEPLEGLRHRSFMV